MRLEIGMEFVRLISDAVPKSPEVSYSAGKDYMASKMSGSGIFKNRISLSVMN